MSCAAGSVGDSHTVALEELARARGVDLKSLLILILAVAAALTLAFTTFVLFQFFNAFNARAEERSAFGANFFSNWRLWAALATVLVLQVLAVQWSVAQEIFETTGLTAGQWLIAVAVASSMPIVEELRKLIARLR